MRRHGYVGIAIIVSLLAAGIILISGLSQTRMLGAYLFILILAVLSATAYIAEIKDRAVWCMIVIIAMSGSFFIATLNNLALISYNLNDDPMIQEQIDADSSFYTYLMARYDEYKSINEEISRKILARDGTNDQSTVQQDIVIVPAAAPEIEADIPQEDYVYYEYEEEGEDD